MTVPLRRVGRSELDVPLLSLGSWHTWDRVEFHSGLALLERALDAGVNFFDVAVYEGVPAGVASGRAYTDVIFGRLLQQLGVPRAEYTIGLKVWLDYWPEQSFTEQVARASDRIGTDRFEYLCLGGLRGADTDIGRIVEEVAAVMVKAGTVCWGVNNWDIATCRAAHEYATAHGLPAPQMNQLKYSVCRRAVADGQPWAALVADTGMSLQPSDVFEGGFLAGSTDPQRKIGRDPGGIRLSIAEAAGEVRKLASGLGVTPAQLSLAYCLAHPDTATVLFGVSSASQLDDNLGAVQLLERTGSTQLRQLLDGLCRDCGIVDSGGSES